MGFLNHHNSVSIAPVFKIIFLEKQIKIKLYQNTVYRGPGG